MKITGYLAQQCAERRERPRNDLISLAVQGEIDGRKLTDDELTGFCFNLFVGGLDTVSTNMSNQFRHLGENPEDQDYLRANPEAIADAIDEMMRAYAAVTTMRLCVKDTSIGGAEIKQGDLVLMPTHLAANDPAAFPRPEVVDFLTQAPPCQLWVRPASVHRHASRPPGNAHRDGRGAVDPAPLCRRARCPDRIVLLRHHRPAFAAADLGGLTRTDTKEGAAVRFSCSLPLDEASPGDFQTVDVIVRLHAAR